MAESTSADTAAKWIFIPLTAKYTVNGVVDYKSLFLIPTGMALVAAIILAVGFYPPKDVGAHIEGDSPTH